MDKALKADEVYKIARPVIDVHLKDVKESRRESDSIAKLNDKLIRQKAEIESSLLKIYTDNRDQILSKMEKLVNSNAVLDKSVSDVMTMMGYTKPAIDTVISSKDYMSVLPDFKTALANLENELRVRLPTYERAVDEKVGLEILNTRIDAAAVKLPQLAAKHFKNKKLDNNLHLLNKASQIEVIKVLGEKPFKESKKPGNKEMNRLYVTYLEPLLRTNPGSYRVFKTGQKGLNTYIKPVEARIAKLEPIINGLKSDIILFMSVISAIEKISNVELPSLQLKFDEESERIVEIKEKMDLNAKRIQSQLKEQELPNVRINKANRLLREHREGQEIKPGRVIKFEDIANYDTVEDLMEDDDMLLIIYRYREMFGHWVGLFRNSYGLNYFNSSGTYIDKAIDGIPHKYKHESGQNFPHLLQLLRNANSKVFFNDVKIQGDNTNTCGRWVGYCFNRCAGENGSRMEDFVAEFSKTKNPDKVIVALTDPLLEAQKDISYPVTFL